MSYATIAYVPVLHSGYLQFFKRYRGALHILGNDFLKEFEHLGRDIRALQPEEMAVAVRALNIFSEVHVLNLDSLRTLQLSSHEIVMPNEDVSKTIAERYFAGREIIFDSIFLRYDKINTTSEKNIASHRVISEETLDQETMARAYLETKKSPDWWRQVGALAVRDGRILITAFNQHMPHEQSLYALGDPRGNFVWGEKIELSNARHAERAIINYAASREGLSLVGASLYVTTFPCPPCAMDIAECGFRRVYYREGYSLAGAEAILKAKSVEIICVEM